MAEGQQPIDYAALAKQAGSVASTPAPSKVDYAALAKQSGSVASTPPPAPTSLEAVGIDPSKVAGAGPLGLSGAPPTPNHIQNPLSGMAKTPKDRAVAQSMENSSQQMENFNDAATSETAGAVKSGVNRLKDWAKQPASFDKYVLQPGAAAINMGGAMVNLPYEAAATAVTGHPIEAAQTLLNSDETKAQEFEKQGNEGGAAWERYGKPVAGLVATEGLAPVLDMAGNVIRGTRFENNNLAAIMAPGFKGDELPQYAAADLMPYYKQEAAAQGLKDENFLQRMFTGDTPSRSTLNGKGPINETIKGMDKVRNVADQVVNRIDARVNGPNGVMEQAANDPVAPQTKQTILNGLEAEKATASRLGSRFDSAYDALIKQVEEADTYGKLNQIKKDSNNMIEGVLNGGPKENAAMSVEPIIAWKKAGDLIRQNMYPDLQRYVAPQGSPGYFNVADTGRLEGQAMSARDGIYANYKEAGHANLPEVAQKYLEGVTEGSLYKTHVIRRMLKILPTPAGEFNKTFRRGIGTLGEGSVPESVTPKKPQFKLPPPSSPDLQTMTPGQPVSFKPMAPPPNAPFDPKIRAEIATVTKRFDAMHPDEVNAAYRMSGDELNKNFNSASDRVQKLMNEGRAISDPELAKAQQQASLYHQLELKRAIEPRPGTVGMMPYPSSKPVLPTPPAYGGKFSVPTGAPVEPTQVTPRLPQKYLGTMQVPNPDHTPLTSTSQYQQGRELGTTASTIPDRTRGFPTAVSQGSNATGSSSVWSPARVEANQLGVGHSPSIIPAPPAPTTYSGYKFSPADMTKEQGFYKIDVQAPSGESVGHIQAEKTPDGSYMIADSNLDANVRGQGVGTAAYSKLIDDLNRKGITVTSDWDRRPAAEAIWQKMEKRGLAEKVPAPDKMMRAADGKMVNVPSGQTIYRTVPQPATVQPRNFGKPTPPLRSFTGPETYTASNWQYLTGSAEPPTMVGHNGAAVMSTSDPTIAKHALDGMRNYQETQGFGKLPKEEQKLHTDALDKLEKQYADYQKWHASHPLPAPPGAEPKFEVWLNPGKTGTKIASRMKSRLMAQGARLGVQGVLSGNRKAADMTPEQRKADDDRRQAEQDEIIRNYKEPQ